MLFSKDSDSTQVSPASGARGSHPAHAGPLDLPNHDLHNHTTFSGHSDDDATVENLVARGNELHLDVLGISEHLMRAADLGMYSAFQFEAHRHRSPRTQVLIGVEMDIDPADPEGRWVVPQINCDYVILSAHGFPQFGIEPPESEAKCPRSVVQRKLAMRWLQWYGLAVARGGMQILGHPLREPINMGLIDLADAEMLEVSLAVFRPAVDRGIAFELNDALLGHLDDIGHFEGYVELVHRLQSMGMRFARGSDSHSAAKVGGCEMIALAAETAGLHATDWIEPRVLLGH